MKDLVDFLNEIALYCIVLYCIVLYCIVLYCIILYCIVLYAEECSSATFPPEMNVRAQGG